MTPRERQFYVGGFLDGNSSNSLGACEDMEDTLESIKFRDGIVVSDHPCRQFHHEYTHVQVGSLATYTSVYVSVIDDFYKHPECRVMPYAVLLEHLDDSEYKSGEDLYKFVRSGNASWGFFSGFDGIENCYGIDRKH